MAREGRSKGGQTTMDSASSVRDSRLESEIIRPEQFFPKPESLRGQPEKRLMLAVLQDAVKCFQDQFVEKGREAERLARQAEEWFNADSPRWPFSFINICAVLGIDPDYLRLGLLRWKEAQKAKERGKDFLEGGEEEAIRGAMENKVLDIASKKQRRAA